MGENKNTNCREEGGTLLGFPEGRAWSFGGIR